MVIFALYNTYNDALNWKFWFENYCLIFADQVAHFIDYVSNDSVNDVCAWVCVGARVCVCVCMFVFDEWYFKWYLLYLQQSDLHQGHLLVACLWQPTQMPQVTLRESWEGKWMLANLITIIVKSYNCDNEFWWCIFY